MADFATIIGRKGYETAVTEMTKNSLLKHDLYAETAEEAAELATALFQSWDGPYALYVVSVETYDVETWEEGTTNRTLIGWEVNGMGYPVDIHDHML